MKKQRLSDLPTATQLVGRKIPIHIFGPMVPGFMPLTKTLCHFSTPVLPLRKQNGDINRAAAPSEGAKPVSEPEVSSSRL